MRKRIVIAVAVLAVVGVAGYVSSQPRKGTVEYHKREYLRAWDHLNNGTPWDRIKWAARGLFNRVTRTPGSGTSITLPPLDSRAALLELGYLQRQIIWLTNSTDSERILKMLPWHLPNSPSVNRKFTSITTQAPSDEPALWISAPAADIPHWVALIRKLDVPEKKK